MHTSLTSSALSDSPKWMLVVDAHALGVALRARVCAALRAHALREIIPFDCALGVLRLGGAMFGGGIRFVSILL